jgi:uncharacterized membrane protein YgcG
VKLVGHVAVHVKGEDILRRPGLWDRLRRAFGGDPDLRTGRMKASLEAEAVVDAVRDALRSIGVTNAVSLVVDDLVVFHDKAGRPDDLGDLFLAFHEHAAAIGGGFDLLRLAVEHVEAGLHLVVEVQARTEHRADEAAVRILVSGRRLDLAPAAGEDAEAYQARVGPLTRERTAIAVATAQFESFVDRVRGAVAMAMPEARAEVNKAEAQIVRPPAPARARRRPAPAPTDRNYDPYVSYYPSPLSSTLDSMMWMSIFSMSDHPHVTVINDVGDTLGSVDTPDIQHLSTEADQEPDRHGGAHDDRCDGGGTYGDEDRDAGGGGDDCGDSGGGDSGGGDSGGGDSGGGDSGGGD